MAKFEPCFEAMILAEGGYKLHEIEGDTGGLTYAGIAYNKHPNWPGWIKIHNKEFDSKLTQLVRDFYHTEFWNEMKGDNIESQKIAENIFLFFVNTGPAALRLVQHVIKTTPDGVVGPKTIKALNASIEDEKDEIIFTLLYALSAIFRYKNISYNDKRRKYDKIKSNLKFLIGWINRIENGLK